MKDRDSHWPFNDEFFASLDGQGDFKENKICGNCQFYYPVPPFEGEGECGWQHPDNLDVPRWIEEAAHLGDYREVTELDGRPCWAWRPKQ